MIYSNHWSLTLKNVFVILAACSLTMSAHAGCYSVYGPGGKLLLQSSEAPVDTRLDYHSTVPQRFGQGATLVYINDGQSCAEVGTLDGVSNARPAQATKMSNPTQESQGRPGRADRG